MIRRFHFLAGMLLLTFTLPAQSNFEWGFSLYPNYSHRRLVAANDLTQLQLRAIEERETARFSYSAGLLAGWRGERAGFRLGLNLMDSGYQTVKEPFPPNEPNPDDATERRFVYRNLNIELPVELHFIHGFEQQTSFSFMMGFSLSYNLQNYENTIRYFGDTRDLQTQALGSSGFRALNYAFQTGMTYDQKINPGLAFFLQPHFQFWLQGILNNEAGLNRNLYALGLKAGIRFFETGD